MQKPNKLKKIISTIYFSVLFSLLLFLTTAFTVNSNYAKVISQNRDIKLDLPAREFDYTFKVSDKLKGTGEIVLQVEDNKIRANAVGLGMTTHKYIDFLTNIEGKVNADSGEIEVTINGSADPRGIPFPCTFTFCGPLKGFLNKGKLNLIGAVNLSGSFLHYTSFKEKEEILIEIPDPYLVEKIYQVQNKLLASL